MSRRRRHFVDDDVPRLPRGKGITLTGPAIFKVAITAALLVMIIVMQKPCSEAAGRFVGNFDQVDAAPGERPIPRPDELNAPRDEAGATPGTSGMDAALDVPGSSGVYVPLAGKTPEEIKAAVEEARRLAAEKAAGGGSSTRP